MSMPQRCRPSLRTVVLLCPLKSCSPGPDVAKRIDVGGGRVHRQPEVVVRCAGASLQRFARREVAAVLEADVQRPRPAQRAHRHA